MKDKGSVNEILSITDVTQRSTRQGIHEGDGTATEYPRANDISKADDLRSRIPIGAEPWLITFLQATVRENNILRNNGAMGQLKAREAMLSDLLHHANEWYDVEIGVPEAAEILGRCDETVRRIILGGELPDQRPDARGRHRVRRGDVKNLARKRKEQYDPAADAQDIAKLRSSS